VIPRDLVQVERVEWVKSGDVDTTPPDSNVMLIDFVCFIIVIFNNSNS